MAKTESKGELAALASALPTLDPSKAAAALLRSADEGSSDGGDHIYMSFSGKTNTYKLGRDKEQPDPDAVYAIAPGGFVEGWNCWKGGQVVGKHMWSTFDREEQEVTQDQLEDHGPYGVNDRGWSKVMGATMLDIDDAERRKILFMVDSISARNVFALLQKEVGERIRDRVPEIVPLVMWGSEAFTAQGNVNYKPVRDTLGWTTDAELVAFLDDEDGTLDDLFAGKYAPTSKSEEPAAKKKPAARTRRKAT
jgi:hypothetical protein